jgi:hypothetical protein
MTVSLSRPEVPAAFAEDQLADQEKERLDEKPRAPCIFWTSSEV